MTQRYVYTELFIRDHQMSRINKERKGRRQETPSKEIRLV